LLIFSNSNAQIQHLYSDWSGTTYSSPRLFASTSISEDYGPRSYGGYDFHGGIDIGVDQITNTNSSILGDAIVAPLDGKVIFIDNDKLKNIIIKYSNDEYVGYRHIFKSSNSLPKKLGGFVMVKIKGSKETAIIDLTSTPLVAISTLNEGMVEYDVNGNGVIEENEKISISNTVKKYQKIAPIGDSGAYEGQYPPHLHIQLIKELKIDKDGNIHESSTFSDKNSINPLSIFDYIGVDYDIFMSDFTNFNQSSLVKIRTQIKDKHKTSLKKRYKGGMFDIQNVSIRIGRSTQSTFLKMKNSDGSLIEFDFGNKTKFFYPEKALVKSHVINNWKISPTAYNSERYDDFYLSLSNFESRIVNPSIVDVDVNGLSEINSEALYSDGSYMLKAVVEPIKERNPFFYSNIGPFESSTSEPFVIDNFLPYIKKVTLSDSEGVFYEAEWVRNSSETALELEQCTYRNGLTTGFNVQIETSETLENLSMNLAGVSNNLVSINTEKTVWKLQNPFNGNVFENQTITFSGTDTAENLLLTDPTNLYWRTGDNTWKNGTTNQTITGNSSITGTDTIHKINLPVDRNCSSTFDCLTDPLETVNNYILPNNNLSNILLLNNDYVHLNRKAYICFEDDVDKYDFKITHKGELSIYLTQLSENYQLELYKNGLPVDGSYGDNNSSSSETIKYSVNSTSTDDYTIVIYGENGVYSELEYKLDINWQPELAWWENWFTEYVEAFTVTNLNICKNIQTQLIVNVPSECQNQVDYLWVPSTGLSCDNCPNPFIQISENTNYTLFTFPKNETLTNDSESCYSEQQVTVFVTPSPTANAGQDQNITSGQSYQLQGYGGSNVSWSPTSTLDNPNIWNPVATPSQTTKYTLTVTENGCTDTDQITIYVDETGGGAAPENDNCANAGILTSHTYQSFTNGTVEDATQSGLGANQCSGSGQTSQDDYDVFYKFTAVSNSHTITIKDLASNFDGVIEIRSGCGLGTNIMCYDPLGSQSPMSLTYDNFVENQTYYIRVFEYNYISSPPSSDTFKICVTHEGNTDNPPANDNCSNAETLTSHTYENFIGGTVSEATESVGANSCSGYMSDDDFDVYYKFTAVESSHTIHLSNYANNFDAVIELRTSCQSGSSNYISCYDPTGTPSSIDRTWNGLNIGQTYYIRVFEYDYVDSPPSLDTFDICVTHEGISGDIDLVSEIISVSDSNPDDGDDIDVTYTVTNQGDIDLNNATFVGLYWSTDDNYHLTFDDYIPNSGQTIYSINAGQTITLNKTITIENGIFHRWYYLISNPDYQNQNSESNEDNNYDAYPIHVGEIEAPDIEIRNITVTPNSNLAPGQEINVEFELENDGNEDCNGFENLIVFDRNNNGIYDAGDDIIGERSFNGLDEGENHTRDRDCYLPINIPSTGTYKILIIADSDDDINESDEGDNQDDATMTISTITPAGPDLIANFLSVEIDDGNIPVSELNLCMGVRYTFRFNTENIGNLETTSSSPGKAIRTYCYISKDEIISGDDVYVGSDNASTRFYIGEINNGSAEEKLKGFEEGDYFLLLFADRNNIINEIDESNVFSTPIRINNCNNELLPDLKIDIESYSPYSPALGGYITVNLLITNIGEIGVSDFEIDLFLSENQIFDGDGSSSVFNDHQLADDGSETIQDVLEPRQTIQLTMTAYIRSDSGLQGKIDQTGIYYLFASIDEKRSINELSRDNNIDFVPIELISVDCYYHQTNEVLTIPYNQPSTYLFHVASEEGCAYNVDGQEDWINHPNNIIRSGQAAIYVNINNNPYPYPRTGHINYGNEVFEFTQESKPCELLSDNIKISISSNSIINIDCTTNGSIDISVQNGFPPYTYVWSTGAITQDIQDISETGNYTVTISDIYGCTISETFTILHTEEIDSSVSINDTTLVSGQNIADSYQWIRCDTGNTVIAGATNQNFEVQDNGTYKVQIINGDCSDESECIEAIWNYTNTSISVPTQIKRTENYTVKVIVQNNGTLEVSEPVTGKLFVSDSDVFDSINATLLSSEIINPIVVNGNYVFNKTLTMSGDMTLGAYYYHFLIDTNNDLTENNESDNTITSAKVSIVSQHDVSVVNIRLLSSNQLSIYNTFAMRVSIKNNGIVTESNMKYKVYFSPTNVFDESTAIVLSSGLYPNTITQGSLNSYNISNIQILETLPLGSGYIFYKIDSNNQLTENNEIDNVSSPLSVNIVCGYQLDAYDFTLDIESSSSTTSNVSINSLKNLICSEFKAKIYRNGYLTNIKSFNEILILKNLIAGNYKVCISIDAISPNQFSRCYNFSVIEDIYSIYGYVDCSNNEPKLQITYTEENIPTQINVYHNNSTIWDGVYNNTFTIPAGISYENNNVCFTSSINELSNSYCHEVYIDDLPDFEVEQNTFFENNSFINISAEGGLPPYTISLSYSYDGTNYNTEIFHIDEPFTNYTIPLYRGNSWVRISHSLNCNDQFRELIYILNEYKLFPNPTTDILNISIPINSQSNGSYIDIVDMNNRIIISEQSFGYSKTRLSIDVSQLSSAVYIVHIYDKNRKLLKVLKFIKK